MGLYYFVTLNLQYRKQLVAMNCLAWKKAAINYMSILKGLHLDKNIFIQNVSWIRSRTFILA